MQRRDRARGVSGLTRRLALTLASSSVVIGCGGSSTNEHAKDAGPTAHQGVPDAGAAATLPRFSFFVTSSSGLQRLATDAGLPDGFGGDLRYGETGAHAGLRGADKICAALAEQSMPGSSSKGWRAFLSTSYENAIDRVGEGPWYDRLGRVLALTKSDLLHERPANADSVVVDDFPNEDGVPNHDPDGTGPVDNHDMLTGTNELGMLFVREAAAGGGSANCEDWTSTAATAGRPRVGHSWPRAGAGPGAGGLPFPGFGDGGVPFPPFGDGGVPFPPFGDGGFPFPLPGDGGFPPFPAFGDGGVPFPPFGDGGLPPFGAGGPFGAVGIGGDGSFNHWISALDEAGCGAGGSVIEMGPPRADHPTVGSGGGYGGFYCFALVP